MTILRAEVKFYADEQVLITDTVIVDTDERSQPWTWFYADIIDVAKQAHLRFRPGFGQATPDPKVDEKPWEQMEFDHAD